MSGRKRNPLAPLSPSSVGKTQKRTSLNERVHATTDDKSSLEKENVVPNTDDQKKFSSGMECVSPGSHGASTVTGSRSMAHQTPVNSGIGLKFNSEQYGTASSGIESMQGASQCRAQSRQVKSRGVTAGSSVSSVPTPSQRRLENVNLSKVGSNSSVSRLLASNSSSHLIHDRGIFQLPASRINSGVKLHSDKQQQQLLRSYNIDRGVLGERHSPLYQSRTTLDSRILKKSKTTSGGPSKRIATVTVPDLDEIGVKTPEWFSNSGQHDGVGTSGARNLLNSFNYVADDFIDVNPFPDPEEDSDDDEDESHLGEYITDDEQDASEDIPDLWKDYMDLGPPTKNCLNCGARMWNEERNNKSSKNNTPTFSICCKDGQVQLPPERSPPPFLASLLHGGEKSSHFKQNIRTYNSMFQFTSIGGKIDHKLNNGQGPYCFKLNGQNYHLIGSLKPKEGVSPKFSQLYVYDTENEIENRMNAVPGSDQLDPEIVQGLLQMLDTHNKLAEGFRMARDRFKHAEPEEFSLLLVSSKSASGRPNQIGPSNEVAALIVGDEEGDPFRDIVVQTKQRFLKRVFETCKHYMQLQYPLLFPFGDDGFHLNIPLHCKKHKTRAQKN